MSKERKNLKLPVSAANPNVIEETRLLKTHFQSSIIATGYNYE